MSESFLNHQHTRTSSHRRPPQTDTQQLDVELCASDLVEALIVIRDFDYRSGWQVDRQGFDEIIDSLIDATPNAEALTDCPDDIQPVLVMHENVLRLLEGADENAQALKALWTRIENILHKCGFTQSPEEWPGVVLPDDLLKEHARRQARHKRS